MSKARSVVACVLGLAVVACGGSSSPPPASTTSGAGSETPHTEPTHVYSIEAVRSFHGIFAPIFHADPGPTRATSACDNVSGLREHALTVQHTATPEHVDPRAWQDATEALVADVDALGAECTAHGAEVEAKLATLHDAFHRVMELSGAHHEEHHAESGAAH